MRGPSSVAAAMRLGPGIWRTSPLSLARSSRGESGVVPFHAERAGAGIRVDPLAGEAESFALLVGDVPRIVVFDVELEKARRVALGFAHERAGNSGAERVGVHGELIEPA